MKIWRRCVLKHGQACGGPCRSVITEGQPMLEVQNDQGIRLVRCAACAKHRYGMEPPDVFPEDERIAVPAPTLPIDELYRHEHGTVMLGKHRRRTGEAVADDFKSRQSGER